jgi:hypothetical protein
MSNNHKPDSSEIEKIEERMKDATRKLHQLVPLIGAAETVIEFNSDQRKNLLAKHQRRYIERGEGAANSEALGRSDPLYLEDIKPLEASHTEAQRIKYEWKATMCSYEAARSLLARQRETLKTLEG